MYNAPTYFPVSYFGGSTDSAAQIVITPRFGIGYHAANYYAGDYFTGSYFASNNAIPKEFAAALRSVLISDGQLRRLVPGGFRKDTQDPRTPYPKGFYSLISSSDELVTGGYLSPYIRTGILQVSIYGSNPDRVKCAGDRVIAVLTDLSYLRWWKGYLMMLNLADPSSAEAPTQGGRAASIKGEIRQFNYQISGSY